MSLEFAAFTEKNVNQIIHQNLGVAVQFIYGEKNRK